MSAENVLIAIGENYLDTLELDDYLECGYTEQELIDEGFEIKTDERKIKRVVRQGRVTKKLFCKPGFKASGGKCVPMSGKEKAIRKKAAIKGGRKRKQQSQAVANRSRKRSLKKRNSI